MVSGYNNDRINQKHNFEKTYSSWQLQNDALGKHSGGFDPKEGFERYRAKMERIGAASWRLVDRLEKASKGKVQLYRPAKVVRIDDLTGEPFRPYGQPADKKNFELTGSKHLPLNAHKHAAGEAKVFASFVRLHEQRGPHRIMCGSGLREIPGIAERGQLQFRYAVLTGGPRVDVDSLESRIIYIMPTYRCKTIRNIKSL